MVFDEKKITEKIQDKSKIEKILGSDISREIPANGETEIVLQRHEKYIVDDGSESAGSLYEDAKNKSYEQTKKILEEKLRGLPGSEKKNIYFLVAASDTKYKGYGGLRSVETAEMITKAIKEVMAEQGMGEDQFLNNSGMLKGDDVRPVPQFREPNFFVQSPEFVDFLKNKYGGINQEFWNAFEKDIEKEKREELKAEGPPELLKRFSDYVDVLRRFSKMYHHKNQGRRMIIWTVSHYDVVSPYVKNKITKTDPNLYLPVDYGGGISIKVSSENNATCKLRGVEYEIN